MENKSQISAEKPKRNDFVLFKTEISFNQYTRTNLVIKYSRPVTE